MRDCRCLWPSVKVYTCKNAQCLLRLSRTRPTNGDTMSRFAAILVAAAAALAISAPARAEEHRAITTQVDASDPATMAVTFASDRACEHQLVTRRTVGVAHYASGPASWDGGPHPAARVVFKVRRDGVLRRTVAFADVASGEHVSIRPAVRTGREKTIEVYVDGALVDVEELRPLDDCPDFS